MTESVPNSKDAETPFHLKGNFAPVFEERSVDDLEVSGAIPPELNGRFFRNGSNPASGWSPHWFLGDGMIHGVELQKGRAVWYRNRYVQTPLITEPGISRILPDGTMDRRISFANTHVIHHAGKILALEEGSFPWQVDRELETVGHHDFGGKLLGSMTAHPRICPETGELLFFGSGEQLPNRRFYRASADGEIIHSEEIEITEMVMMHDWSVTRNHVIFMDLPMIFDPAAMAGDGVPIRWSEEHGARLGVLRRDAPGSSIRWIEIDPCYVFHALNGYEEQNQLILDVCRFQRMGMPGSDEGTPPFLTRWTIDLESDAVSEQPLVDWAGDFPRINDRRMGLRHRYGYLAGLDRDEGGLGSALRKVDLDSGEVWTFEPGPGCQAGEPVFAECPGSDQEDAGWIFTYVYDAGRNASDLVILDAQHLDSPPVARVHLPWRVPFGFHGSWIADEA